MLIFERYYIPGMGFVNWKIAAVSAISAILLHAGCTAASAQVRSIMDHGYLHGTVSEASLEGQVSFLADSLCRGRGTGTMGNTEAAFWISRHFSSLGLVPFGGSYPMSFRTADGTVGRNVAGLLRASGDRGGEKRYIVVAAHYDGYGELEGNMYPGADSNASGVVAMLETGKMLKAMMDLGKVYSHDIVFVALDAKNVNMNGAKEFWQKIASGRLQDPSTGRSIRKEDIAMMVNIDQIGSTLSPIRTGRKDYLIFLSDSRADRLRRALLDANSHYGLGLDLGFDYYGSKAFTDLFYREVSEQKVFMENGVPAVMFTSGITMNNNKVRDTADTLDYKVLKDRICAIFHWLEGIM